MIRNVRLGNIPSDGSSYNLYELILNAIYGDNSGGTDGIISTPQLPLRTDLGVTPWPDFVSYLKVELFAGGPLYLFDLTTDLTMSDIFGNTELEVTTDNPFIIEDVVNSISLQNLVVSGTNATLLVTVNSK